MKSCLKNIPTTFFIFFLLLSCSHEKHRARFDHLSLNKHFQVHQMNLIILYDHQLNHFFEEPIFENKLKNFLTELNESFQSRIALAPLDDVPKYFLTNDITDLPEEYSPHFYKIENIKLEHLQKRYNPEVPIFSNIIKIKQRLTEKKFFNPNNDFITLIFSTRDDRHFEKNEAGQKTQNLFSVDLKALSEKSKSDQYILLFSAKSNCNPNLETTLNLIQGAQVINRHYLLQKSHWTNDWGSVDLCKMNLEDLFQKFKKFLKNRKEF